MVRTPPARVPDGGFDLWRLETDVWEQAKPTLELLADLQASRAGPPSPTGRCASSITACTSTP